MLPSFITKLATHTTTAGVTADCWNEATCNFGNTESSVFKTDGEIHIFFSEHRSSCTEAQMSTDEINDSDCSINFAQVFRYPFKGIALILPVAPAARILRAVPVLFQFLFVYSQRNHGYEMAFWRSRILIETTSPNQTSRASSRTARTVGLLISLASKFHHESHCTCNFCHRRSS